VVRREVWPSEIDDRDKLEEFIRAWFEKHHIIGVFYSMMSGVDLHQRLNRSLTAHLPLAQWVYVLFRFILTKHLERDERYHIGLLELNKEIAALPGLTSKEGSRDVDEDGTE